METTSTHSRTATWTLLALALSAFAIGMTEFISVGVMPLLVTAFGVRLSTAGLTVSVYAAGIMIGAPLLTAKTGRVPRKALLLAVMVTFVIGNLATALAPNFWLLLVGRVISAFAHGLFMAVATMIAASVVAADRRASAIATMFTGLTVATVTGVPLGTFIAQHASWRLAFGFIAVFGVVALLLNWLLVPNDLPQPATGRRGGVWRLLGDSQVRASLIITALGYGASFPVYTYISAMLARMGFDASATVILLLFYGLAVAVGNTLGGKFANHRPLHALVKMFAALTVVMIAMLFGLANTGVGLFLLLAMGLLAFMNVPGLQLVVMQAAEQALPEDTQLASALNISAFNVGVMGASFIGGQLLNHWELMATPWGGILFSLGALGLTAWLARQEA
ncbi:MFS transporter [Lacticaseibacillus sp. GG6-2]